MFWGKVAEKFALRHSRTDISVSQNREPRTGEQLQNKFKLIASHMILFNKHWKQLEAERPSGVPENEYADMVAERFKEAEGKPFRFTECVPILHSIVKFSPHVTNTTTPRLQPGAGPPGAVGGQEGGGLGGGEETLFVTPTQPSRTNMVGSVMGSHMSRPIGTQRAKEARADHDLRARRKNGAGATTAVEEASPASGVSAVALAAEKISTNLLKMAERHSRMDAFHVKASLYKFLMQAGEVLEARMVLQEMKAFNQQKADKDGGGAPPPPQEEQEEEDPEDEPSYNMDWAEDDKEAHVTPTPGSSSKRTTSSSSSEDDNKSETSETVVPSTNGGSCVVLLQQQEEDEDGSVTIVGAPLQPHPPGSKKRSRAPPPLPEDEDDEEEEEKEEDLFLAMDNSTRSQAQYRNQSEPGVFVGLDGVASIDLIDSQQASVDTRMLPTTQQVLRAITMQPQVVVPPYNQSLESKEWSLKAMANKNNNNKN